MDEGRDWVRREGTRQGAVAERTLRGRFSEIELAEVEAGFRHAGPSGAFPDDKVIRIPPPKKENATAAALWCRWDYTDSDDPKVGYYVGFWRPMTTVEDGRIVRFLGYRYETPENGNNHDYYHVQPCRSMGSKDKEADVALPLSNRNPTWPLTADDPVELLVCAFVSLYGMDGLREFRTWMEQQSDARRDTLLVGAVDRLSRRSVPRS